MESAGSCEDKGALLSTAAAAPCLLEIMLVTQSPILIDVDSPFMRMAHLAISQ